MRTKEERRAEFERREVVRKAKYADARSVQREKAASREADLRAKREALAATPDVTPLTEDQLDEAARLRLRFSSVPMEGGFASLFFLRTQSRALKQMKADLDRVREADSRRHDAGG